MKRNNFSLQEFAGTAIQPNEPFAAIATLRTFQVFPGGLAFLAVAFLMGPAGISFAASSHRPPVFTSPENATFMFLSANTFMVTTAAGNPMETTLSKTGPLPSGVTFTDNGDGTATLAGAPSSELGSDFTIDIIAANSLGLSVTQSFQLSVDQPTGPAPVVTNCSFTTPAGLPLSIPESQLLAGCYDPAGGPLTLTGIELISTRGAFVTWTNGRVIYSSWERYFFSEDGFSGLDTFNYTVANSEGLTSTGTVTVNVLSGMGTFGPRAVSINTVSNGVFLVFLATYSDDLCRVQYKDDLSAPWQTFPDELMADPGAVVVFTDTTTPAPRQRFYRLEDTPSW